MNFSTMRHSRVRRGAWVRRIVFFAMALSASAASAITYTFESLYDQTEVGFPGFNPPSLNDSGVVSFVGIVAGKNSIVKGNGGPLTTIATQGSTYSAFGLWPAINNSGLVVFNANRTAGNPGIFTSDGIGPTTNINGTLTGNFTTDLGVPSINDSGQVAFVAQSGTQQNIYIGNGGTPTLVGPSSGTVDINNSTTLAWSDGRIRQWKAGATSTLVDTTGPFSSINTVPAINVNGDVSFVGSLDAGGEAVGIYNGTTHTVAIVPKPVASAFSINTEVGINNEGRAVFRTGSPSGGNLYTATASSTDLVLSKGMPLFGSTLFDFQFFRNGFNNAGQVAFQYQLANGNLGIALATPVPEPSSLVLLLLGLAGCAVIAKRKQPQV